VILSLNIIQWFYFSKSFVWFLEKILEYIHNSCHFVWKKNVCKWNKNECVTLETKKILKTLLYSYYAEIVMFLSIMCSCASSLNVEPRRLSLAFLRSLVRRDSFVSYISRFFRTNSLTPRRISGCTHEGKWYTLDSFLAHFHFLKK
jgi:hypothetical protein